MPITVKNSVQLPEIGQIRKGDVKGENKPGADLKDRFRVLFFPGNETSAKLFVEKHPEEKLFPKRIKAMLPFPRLDDCWVVYNEAYSAGRMLARADGEKYITLRDGRTGEYVISDGKPHRAFKVGDTVNYTSSNGKAQSIKIKPVGKLYLFLPELDRAVYMTLKTTSFYDALNIEAQLGAIESIASGINRGSVMGVPIWIYRRPQFITWNQPDGNAVRVEKWLINVEIDTEWIKSAANRMSRFALGGGDLPALPSSFGGDFDPNDEGDDIPDEAQEGSFVDAPQPEKMSKRNDNDDFVPTMTLEFAEKEMNSAKPPVRYGDLATDKLAFMATKLAKSLKEVELTAQEREDKQRKLDACKIILHHRASQTDAE